MPSLELPKHTQILVVGGGPAGSYAAAALAREGFSVVLLEMAKFPRYHIGESLLPSVRHYLRFIDAEEKVASYGFARKPGSAIKFNQYMQEGYTDFVALGSQNNSWNVVRSEFDHLLFQHAASCGARVFDQTRVVSFKFDENAAGTECNMGKPVSALYATPFGGKGEITFDYVIDASGRAGLLSTKYLKNRRFNESLKNVAVWGYWRGTGMYGAGTSRENAPWFEALSDESGWAWFIPLHKGLTSVGVVMDQKQLGIRSRACSSVSITPFGSLPSGSLFPSVQSSIASEAAQQHPPFTTRAPMSLADRYLTFLNLAPGVLKLIGDGELVKMSSEEEGCAEGGAEGNAGGAREDVGEAADGPSARSASDFSYSASVYAGCGWRIIGDAGAFIDPFFSSGVHLALTGALAAAASISASIREDCTEAEASKWHSQRVAISYTRFLVVVLSAYKQIRAQSMNVLADIENENFDKTFAFLRPIIQGGAEMGARLSEDEVQRALDFCVRLFSPTTPEQHENVRRRLEELLLCGVTDTGRERLGHQEGMGKRVEEDHDAVEKIKKLLDVHAPVVEPSTLDSLLRTRLRLSGLVRCRAVSIREEPTSGSEDEPTHAYSSSKSNPVEMGEEDPEEVEWEDEEIRMVLEKVNARRVIQSEHGDGSNSLEDEAVGASELVVRLERGRLGLVKAHDAKEVPRAGV